MKAAVAKRQARIRRHQRVRTRIQGSANHPRLSVAITNHHVIAQLIDDQTGRTLAFASSVGHKLPPTLSQRAVWVGQEIAKKAKTTKIKSVVFDRGPRRYHGRIKALAEAARQNGLEF